jgi:hypothetical protein
MLLLLIVNNIWSRRVSLLFHMTSPNISIYHTALIIACAISTIMLGECKRSMSLIIYFSHILVAYLQISDLSESGPKTSRFKDKTKIFEEDDREHWPKQPIMPREVRIQVKLRHPQTTQEETIQGTIHFLSYKVNFF